MKFIPNTEKAFFGALIGPDVTAGWVDGHVRLSQQELAVLRKAYEICDKADERTRKAHHDPDNFNSFGEATLGLLDILRDHKITDL